MTQPSSIETNLKVLKESPLSQLSLASRELFHSNFLSWLCENHEAFSITLLGGFLSDKQVGGIRVVEREHKNIDLWIHYKDGQDLIVENKVKSLPDSAQLDEYSAKNGTERSSYLLLSLSRPHFINGADSTYRDSGGRTWNILTYRELSERMETILREETCSPKEGTYHHAIIDDYIRYTRALSDLNDSCSVSRDPDGGFFAATDRIMQLPDSRIAAGLVKMRYSQLAAMLCERLRALNFPVETNPTDYWKGANYAVLVWAGMTRSLGMLDFKYAVVGKNDRSGSPPLTLGVQLQGDSFRLIVESYRGNARPAAELFIDRSQGRIGWFDFELLSLPCGTKEYPEKEDFNKFGAVFFYRSKKLAKSVTPDEIVGAIVTYARFLQEHRDEIRERALTI